VWKWCIWAILEKQKGNKMSSIALLILARRDVPWMRVSYAVILRTTCSARKGPTTLCLMYTAFLCISARDCFQDLNPWPHGHKATALPLRQGSTSWCKFFLISIIANGTLCRNVFAPSLLEAFACEQLLNKIRILRDTCNFLLLMFLWLEVQ
jgi:hypothetical protein